MSRRKQANPAKLDSDLGDCSPQMASSVCVDGQVSTSEVKMEATESTGSVSDKNEDEDEDNSETPLPSASDFEDDEGDVENASSTPEASSPTSPMTDEDCTQGVTENTPYGCRYCQKAFPRSYMLTRHEQTHTEQLQFTCSYCPRLFKHKRSRDRHTKLHTGDKKYKCQHCESAFSRSDHLKIHMKTHDGRKPYKCGTCNRGYNTAAALASHQQNHLKREARSASRTSGGSTPSPGSFRCPHCSETFARAELLQNHTVLAHKDSISRNSQDEYSNKSDESSKTVCMYCAKEFSTLELMYHHVSMFHGDVTNGDYINTTQHPLTYRGSPKRDSIRNGCDRCTMHFDSVKKLSEHVSSAHWRPSLPISPSQNSSFSISSSVSPYQSQPTDLSHKKRSETSDQRPAKKTRVGDAPKETGSPYESDDKPCICSCCYAQMPNFKSFLVHMESHVAVSQASASTANSSFLRYCPICGEPGRDPVGFSNHVFGHAITNVPGRCCHTCKKSFDGREELQKHLADVHILSVFKCSICNEIFDTKIAIQVHFSNKHGNECNHFRCYLCSDQIFHDRLTAELHITMQHSQQLPAVSCSTPSLSLVCSTYQEMNIGIFREYLPTFQCPFCQQNFKEEHLYFLHVLNEHGESNDDEKFWVDPLDHRQRQNPSPSSNFFTKTHQSPESNRKLEQKSTDSFSCDLCNTSDMFSENELLAHKKLHHSKSKVGPVSLQCAYCNECCKSRNDLENHMKTHHVSCGKGRYKCNICDEIFSSSIILADHKLRHCKILSGNTCTQCKAVLVNEQSFYAHHIEHSPGKANSQIFLPVNCIICCQTLQTDVELRLHSRFHLKYLNQRAFLCGICSQVYDSLTGEVVKHLADSSSTENLPVTVCKKCASNGTAVYRKNLDSGHKISTPAKQFEAEEDVHQNHVLKEASNLECRLCKQIFSSPLKLQVHLIEHNFYGMNQFSCYVCSSVFTAASGLQSHIVGHGLKSRPYECSQCQMKFFFRAELDNHRFVHLGGSGGGSYVVASNGGSIYETKAQICKFCSGSFLESAFSEHVSKCLMAKEKTKGEEELEEKCKVVEKVEIEESEVDVKEVAKVEEQ